MPASERASREAADRRAQVLRMKIAGMSLDAIAAEIEKRRQADRKAGKQSARAVYTDAHAAMDVKRALAGVQGHVVELAGLHLALELERLDSLTRVTEGILAGARQAMQADPSGDNPARWQALRAIDRLLAIGRRRDTLLGLSQTTSEAAATAGDEGGSSARDAVDQLARKRAERRRSASRR